MMEEIISRRYRKNEERETETVVEIGENTTPMMMMMMTEELPNLIVIDGGKGHLNVALKTLKRIGLEKLDCISLAKENEEVFVPQSNDPITIPKSKKPLKILQHIRDESHRFGLAYNRKLRKITIE